MRFIQFLWIGLALALVVAACGDDEAGPTRTPPAEPTRDSSPTPTSDVSPTPAEEPSDGTPTPTRERSDTDATIELKEFAINPQRTSARPGSVTFHVRNVGDLSHEFLVIRTDLPHAELPRLPSGLGADESRLDVVARIDSIAPGDEAETTLELDSGNYVLICNLSSDSVSHYLRGMYDRFTVSDTAAPPDAPTE